MSNENGNNVEILRFHRSLYGFAFLVTISGFIIATGPAFKGGILLILSLALLLCDKWLKRVVHCYRWAKICVIYCWPAYILICSVLKSISLLYEHNGGVESVERFAIFSKLVAGAVGFAMLSYWTSQITGAREAIFNQKSKGGKDLD